MALNPFVVSTISTAPVSVSRPGFGVPALLSYNASGFGAARTRYYSSLAGVAADFPSTTGPEYLWAQAMFSQASPVPERIAIHRGALAPTLRYAVSVAQRTPGATYEISVRGDGVTSTDLALVLPAADLSFAAADINTGTDGITITDHGLSTGDLARLVPAGTILTATGIAADQNLWVIAVDDDTIRLSTSRANALAGTYADITSAGTGTTTVKLTSNDVLVARTVEALNLVSGANYVAAAVPGTGDADTLTVTASAAGEWFSIGFDRDQWTTEINHADPGVATDLAAIQNAGGDWYELHTAYNSTAYILAVAAWIEAADPRRQYLAESTNTAIINNAYTVGASGDVRATLHSLGYARTLVMYSPTPHEMAGAAWAGRTLGLDPGKVDRSHKALVGVTPMALTETQRINLIGTADAPGYGNGYLLFGGVGITAIGMVASGEWWDVVRNDDYVNAMLVADLFDARRANNILPYSPEGISLLEGVLRARLARAKGEGIYQEPIVVTPTKFADTSANDRSHRKYNGLSWSAKRVGAIVYLEAAGTITT